MKRIETVYALLQAADPVGATARLDSSGVADRIESSLGFPVSAPAPSRSTHMEVPMVTQESTSFETSTPSPTRRSWRGPAIAFGTALVVLLVAVAGSLASGSGRPTTPPTCPTRPCGSSTLSKTA